MSSSSSSSVKTGQHPPVYSQLRPYEDFPQEIQGPTVWRTEDLKEKPESWTYEFSDAEIKELGRAADIIIECEKKLVHISKANFPLPTLGPLFASLRPTLLNERGFILFRNIPVHLWSRDKCAAAYLGLGAHFGVAISQNGRGHILGHVKNLSEDQSQSKVPIRIYRTNKRQFFHTDSADLVGLLCMARSMQGGESDIVSTHHLYNVLQKEHPEVVKLLTEPIWYFDRKGEVSEGEEQYIRTAILQLTLEPEPRVYARFDPMNVTTLERYNSGPDAVIPPLSPAQLDAIRLLEETAGRLALHMILQPGDVQLLANSHIFHARTAYTDWPAGSVDEEGRPRLQRQLMRLWLAVGEEEGGWKLPYVDSKEPRRGGIQIDDRAVHCPLDAE